MALPINYWSINLLFILNSGYFGYLDMLTVLYRLFNINSFLIALTSWIVVFYAIILTFSLILNPYGISPINVNLNYFNSIKPRRINIDRQINQLRYFFINLAQFFSEHRAFISQLIQELWKIVFIDRHIMPLFRRMLFQWIFLTWINMLILTKIYALFLQNCSSIISSYKIRKESISIQPYFSENGWSIYVVQTKFGIQLLL